MSKKPQINNVKERMAMLSERVASGEDRELNWDDFEEDPKELGGGSYAKVYLVKLKKKSAKEIFGGKETFALKSILKAKIIKANMVPQVNLELSISYLLNHPHIIKLYDHFEDEKSINLIMEFAAGGELLGKLREKTRFDEKTAAKYMKQVLSAVEYIQSLNPKIMHRDIKPENILIDEKGNAKLTDFGSANRNSGVPRQTFCGTVIYMAPEIINRGSYDESIDIWGLGILTFELLTGKTPFIEDEFNTDQKQLEHNILNMNVAFPKDFPSLAQDLVSKMLKRNPHERIKIPEINQHPWLILQTKQSIVPRPSFKKQKIGPKNLDLINKELRAMNEEVNPEKADIFNKGSNTLMRLRSEMNDSIVGTQSCTLRCSILRQVLANLNPITESSQKNLSKKILKHFLLLVDSKQSISKLSKELESKRNILHEKEKITPSCENSAKLIDEANKSNEALKEKINEREAEKQRLLKEKSKLMAVLEKKSVEAASLPNHTQQKKAIDVTIERLKKLSAYISNMNLQEPESRKKFEELDYTKRKIHDKNNEFKLRLDELEESENEKLEKELFQLEERFNEKKHKLEEKYDSIINENYKKELDLKKEIKIREQTLKMDLKNQENRKAFLEKDIEDFRNKIKEANFSIEALNKEIVDNNKLKAKLDRRYMKGNF